MKQKSRILASLALAFLFAVELSSCQKAGTTETISPTTAVPSPQNEVDVMINDYEKSTNEYIKVSKKLKGGDVSVTVKYIDLGKELREWPAKHRQMWAKVTPSKRNGQPTFRRRRPLICKNKLSRKSKLEPGHATRRQRCPRLGNCRKPRSRPRPIRCMEPQESERHRP